MSLENKLRILRRIETIEKSVYVHPVTDYKLVVDDKEHIYRPLRYLHEKPSEFTRLRKADIVSDEIITISVEQTSKTKYVSAQEVKSVDELVDIKTRLESKFLKSKLGFYITGITLPVFDIQVWMSSSIKTPIPFFAEIMGMFATSLFVHSALEYNKLKKELKKY